MMGDLDECQSALDDYYGWRAVGGFEPERGDERMGEIARDLAAVQEGRVPSQDDCD